MQSVTSVASSESAAAPAGPVLGQEFFDRDTMAVARELLGKVLVREVEGTRLWGRLVEVEAYLGPDDLAAHSSGGRRSPRNEVMYGPPGHAYVYFTYGMHHCLNFVTQPEGTPQAVLVPGLQHRPQPERGGTDPPDALCHRRPRAGTPDLRDATDRNRRHRRLA